MKAFQMAIMALLMVLCSSLAWAQLPVSEQEAVKAIMALSPQEKGWNLEGRSLYMQASVGANLAMKNRINATALICQRHGFTVEELRCEELKEDIKIFNLLSNMERMSGMGFTAYYKQE